MHPLDGPRAKVDRAKSQFIALQTAFQRFFKRYPYRVAVAEFDKKAGHHNLRVKSGPSTLPDEWGVLIGEIAHNLRSALDGLVCQLALAADRRRTWRFCDKRKTGFPVFLRGPRAKGGHHLTRAMLDYLQDRHAARIESFQPYKRGNGHRDSPLWLLHELNNSDKHRLITVVTVVAGGIHLTGLWGGGGRLKTGVPLNLNAKVGDVPPLPAEGVRVLDLVEGQPTIINGRLRTRTQHEVQVDAEVTPGIRFGDSCDAVKRLPVIRTLQRMANEVSRIIESFASEFP